MKQKQNKIQLKSVAEVIRSGKENEHYLIPDYQRGYRWRAEEHIKALLEDIHQFAQKKRNSDEIYCLQPIVVVKQDEKWEIIDGQQRLTSLYLILRYLNEECYTISYTHREGSEDFLKNPEKENYSTPDAYFITQAYQFIQKWFQEKEKEKHRHNKNFANILTENVKVIWYEVILENGNSYEEKINIFNRLNIGKIPLDDAELIRSLFIQKKEIEDEKEKIINQSIFANEWIEIEKLLQNEILWGFIQKKNDKDLHYANRILKLFEIVAKVKNNQARATFIWFENELNNKNQNAENLWKEVKRLVAKIKYWFEDSELYHYIGLLMTESSITISDVYEISNQQTKSEFKDYLKKETIKKFGNIKLDELSYGENNSECLKTLLFFNVFSAMEKSIEDISQRFPFHRYLKVKIWSLEHIHAQNSEDALMKNEKNINAWKNESLSFLKMLQEKEKSEEIDNLITLLDKCGTDNIEEFDGIRKEIENFLGDFQQESEDLHSINNLTLLSSKDNSALNNAIFPNKREKIINLEKEGSFIPMCTKNVFLKTYSNGFIHPYKWDKEDRKNYEKEIRRVLKDYIF